MVSGSIDSDDPAIQKVSHYIGSHSLLPKGYDSIPTAIILKMGELLLFGRVSIPTKEAILIILAHHPTIEALGILNQYSLLPDPGLDYFAQAALEECQMWNNGNPGVIYNVV